MSLACFTCNKDVCKKTCMQCRDVLKFEIVEYLLDFDCGTDVQKEVQYNLKLLQNTLLEVRGREKQIVYLNEENRNKNGRPKKFNLNKHEVLAKYKELGSYCKVAKFYGCSSTYIINLINNKKPKALMLTESQKQEILSIYDRYKSLRKAATIYGCTYTHFKKLLDSAKVEL